MAAENVFNPKALFAYIGILNERQVGLALNTARDLAIGFLRDRIELFEAQLDRYTADQQPFIRRLINRHEGEIAQLSQANPEANLVKNTKGEAFGHAYIWTDSKELYEALIGNDFDGSRAILNPEWLPAEDVTWDFTNYEVHQAKVAELIANEQSLNDNPDLTLPEEKRTPEEIAAAIEANYEGAFILTPSFLPAAEYDEGQLKEALAMARALSQPDPRLYARDEKELARVGEFLASDERTRKYAADPAAWIEYEWDRIEKSRRVLLGDVEPLPRERPRSLTLPEMKDLPQSGGIVVERARAHFPKPGLIKHILFAAGVPSWLKAETIRSRFIKFNSDPRLKRVGSEDKPFPIVELIPTRTPDPWGGKLQLVKVIFSDLSPYETNAIFAINMRRQVTFDYPAGIKPDPRFPEGLRLIFNFYDPNPPRRKP